MSQKILVVDDEEIVRRVIRLHLEREGWVGIEVRDGVEALEILKKEPIDLVLCDIKMPRMDGIHFLKQLKEKGLSVPVIMVSGFVDMEMAIEVMRQGTFDYLTKPIQRNVLIFSVKRGLEYKELVEDRRRLEAENIKFQENLEQKVAEQTALIEQLFEVSIHLTTLEGLETIADFLVESISRLTKSRRVSVLLYNKSSRRLEIIKAKGVPLEWVKKTRQEVGEPIAGKVYADGKAVIIDEIGEKNGAKGYSASKAFVSFPILSLPLGGQNNPLGIINATDKDGDVFFNRVDLKILESLAASASVAFQNDLRRMDIETVYLELVKTLAEAIETKDPYTRGHCERVPEISLNIAKTMGLSLHQIRDILLAGILHDVGKIGIPEGILTKAGPLDQQEWGLIHEHPDMGLNIIQHVGFLGEAREIIAQHHERYDGTGYPKGLKGESIHLGARILAVADAFDAMSSNRPYHSSLNKATIIEEIRSQAGLQFDPQVVEIFLNLLAQEEGKE
jgi:response regulator RpfG family c-di-GMP phosphodiesterase